VKDADEAPDWLDKEEPKKPLSRGQKIALDITALILVPFCFWAGWLEFHRALEGRWQAWVYSFEWPLFGFVGIWLWKRFRSGDPIKLPKIEPPKFDGDELKN
jgi:hypothetical protein